MKKLIWHYLVDGLAAEREQGITIDVAYPFFSTNKRKFIVADTPGHVQYTRNMATGASTADVAVLLIDARYGVQEQSRRHAYIVSLFGVKQSCCGYQQNGLESTLIRVFSMRLKLIFENLLKILGFPILLLFLSRPLNGDNVTTLSEPITMV